MNYMEQVAKMFNVELGEKFEINENDNWICSFVENQFEIATRSNAYVNVSLAEHVLTNLIGGVYTIKRKPWKPDIEEMYYIIDENGYSSNDYWFEDSIDLNYYKLGNCYRTKEEAEANSAKWMAFYKSDEVLNI